METHAFDDEEIDGWFFNAHALAAADDAAEAAAVQRTFDSAQTQALEGELLAQRLTYAEEEERLLELALRESAATAEADAAVCRAAAEDRRERWRNTVCARAISQGSVPRLCLEDDGRPPALWALAATAIAAAGYRGRRCVTELKIPFAIAMLVERAADARDMLLLRDVPERAGLPNVVYGPPVLGKRPRIGDF